MGINHLLNGMILQVGGNQDDQTLQMYFGLSHLPVSLHFRVFREACFIDTTIFWEGGRPKIYLFSISLKNYGSLPMKHSWS